MVLDDDDLLREILVRLVFPASLVHAALVCKRWLNITSDPALLHRFRNLHPPLLGIYLKCWKFSLPKFMVMPHIQGLDTMICRARSAFDAYSDTWGVLYGSQNGCLLGRFHRLNSTTDVLLNPLNLERNIVTLPPLPSIDLERGMSYRATEYVLNDQSCLGATLVISQDRTTVHLYELLDVINLPDGLEYKYGNLGLSQADGTGFNLVHLKELELHIWLCTHKHSSNNNSICDNWLLVHTICLREVCASLRMPTRALENGKNAGVKLHAIGDNAEVVFLEICSAVIYLDIARRVAEKVYTLAPGDGDIYKIHPFTMIWPPTFPCPQIRTRPKGMVQPERAPTNANQQENELALLTNHDDEVLSTPPGDWEKPPL
uniref:Uncharacterized protein n=1 Tax=Aegilops tauschii TaxID=37682 RepID=R7W3Y0_AEGTA